MVQKKKKLSESSNQILRVKIFSWFVHFDDKISNFSTLEFETPQPTLVSISERERKKVNRRADIYLYF